MEQSALSHTLWQIGGPRPKLIQERSKGVSHQYQRGDNPLTSVRTPVPNGNGL